MRRSFTITAATWRREQLLRVFTTWAMSMKYSSQPGRTRGTGAVPCACPHAHAEGLDFFLAGTGLRPS